MFSSVSPDQTALLNFRHITDTCSTSTLVASLKSQTEQKSQIEIIICPSHFEGTISQNKNDLFAFIQLLQSKNFYSWSFYTPHTLLPSISKPSQFCLDPGTVIISDTTALIQAIITTLNLTNLYPPFIFLWPIFPFGSSFLTGKTDSVTFLFKTCVSF